jgi:hypothetical protein
MQAKTDSKKDFLRISMMTVLELATTKIALYKIYIFLHLFPFCRQLTPFTPLLLPPLGPNFRISLLLSSRHPQIYIYLLLLEGRPVIKIYLGKYEILFPTLFC